MAYDLVLADRRRVILDGEECVTERKMFGGIAFMVIGNMAVGVLGDELMVRVGAPRWTQALVLPGIREMDFTGRSMKGYVFVEPSAPATESQLEEWIEHGVTFALSLCAK